MSSIVRASPRDRIRRWCVLGAAVFAVVVGQGQMLLGWGQTAAEFAADSDAVLRVEGYAFSIWGVIYLALLAYAVRQALPQTGESRLIHVLGWPSFMALIGIGLWIVAAALDAEAATIVLIVGSLLVLLVPLLIEARTVRALGRGDRDRWLTAWPLGLLAGWLAIAAAVNLITVLVGNGVVPVGATGTAIALGALAAVSLIALAVVWRLRSVAFALPIAWGLVGVFVAEQPRNAILAYAALILAGAVLVGAAVIALGLRPGVERAQAS